MVSLERYFLSEACVHRRLAIEIKRSNFECKAEYVY
jgi:hypothetical protein